jgi:hypothetical protein
MLISEMRKPQDAMKVRVNDIGVLAHDYRDSSTSLELGRSLPTRFRNDILRRICRRDVLLPWIKRIFRCLLILASCMAKNCVWSRDCQFRLVFTLFLTLFFLVVQLTVHKLRPSAGGIYSHTGAKILFVRLFRRTPHLHTHTLTGWIVWIILCILAVGIAFVLAVAVPIFSYLNSLTSALFASWYTYGIAGFFWLYDVYHVHGDGGKSLGVFRKRPVQTALAVGTVLAGGFICVAGTYVSIKVRSNFLNLFSFWIWADRDSVLQLIIEAYQTGTVGQPFTC